MLLLVSPVEGEYLMVEADCDLIQGGSDANLYWPKALRQSNRVNPQSMVGSMQLRVLKGHKMDTAMTALYDMSRHERGA